MAEISSVPAKSDKPVIVRVKRKAFHSRIDAFWLEINERPLKRPLLDDFGKLSLNDSSSTATATTTALVEELKKTKVLVRHVETVTTSEETFDVLRSFVPNSSDAAEGKGKSAGRAFRTVKKQNELLMKAKQNQEALARNARFEQIWRSRRENKEAAEEESVYEMCRLYDVVRVDEPESKVPDKGMDLEDCKMMAQYLPLLWDVLPAAAEEVECDIQDSMSKQAASSDGYVYDFYAVEETTVMESDFHASQIPLVQVDDDSDYYDGPDDSEYESDDSNAENNPLNDYPDEEITEDEEEVTSESSDENSEAESRTSGSESEDSENADHESYEFNDSGPHYLSDDGDQFFVDEMYSDGDVYVYGDDSGDEE